MLFIQCFFMVLLFFFLIVMMWLCVCFLVFWYLCGTWLSNWHSHFHFGTYCVFSLGNFYWHIFKLIDSFFSYAQPTDEPMKGIVHLLRCFLFGAFPFDFQHFHLSDYITHLFLYVVCATFINPPQFWDKHPASFPYYNLSKLSCVLTLLSRGNTWSQVSLVHGLCV